MKILPITPYNKNHKKSFTKAPAFKGESKPWTMKNAIEEMQNIETVKKVLQEKIDFTDKYYSELDKQLAISENKLNSNLLAKIEYEKLLKKIKDLPIDCPTDKQKKFIDFYNQVSLSVPEKFKRVAGYENLKKMFIDDFIIGTVGVDKIAKEGTVNMPNAVLLYGPTGVGKSNLAQAVAELTDSFVLKPKFADVKEKSNSPYFFINDETREKYYDLVKKQCEDAKTNYEKNIDNKKRTIIILDETDSVLCKDAKIKDKFYDLIKNSNEKYKTIFFITTNNPLDLDEKFLAPEICGKFNSLTKAPKRAIIGIPPANREDAEAIIKQHFDNMGRSLGSESPKPLVDKLFESKKTLYNNKDIKNIIKETFNTIQEQKNKFHPSIDDCVEYIKKTQPTRIINVEEWKTIFEKMSNIVMKTIKKV